MKKKRIYTFTIPICIIAALSAFCWWAYNSLSLQEKQADTDLFAWVPNDCQAIIATKNVDALYKTLSHAHYIQQYGMPEVSDLLNLILENIESLSEQQAHGLSTEMNSQLLVSFHRPGTVRDQIIYGRLGNGDISSVTRLLQSINNGRTYPPKSIDYKGEKITILPIGDEFLACYIRPDFFAISFQKRLIERVIDTHTVAALKEKASPTPSDRQHKHDELLSLYLPPTSMEGDWRHFEIRMNADAIFLTGNHRLTDADRFSGDENELVKRTDGTLLPKHVQMMVQTPLYKSTTEATSAQNTLFEVVKEAGVQEMISIRFYSEQADTVYPLLLLPLPIDAHEPIRQALRYPLKARRRPSIWTKNGASPVWQCTTDSVLTSKLIVGSNLLPEQWISIHQDNLLLADCREALHTYITEMQQQADTTDTEEGEAFIRCLDDLAEQANYTQVTDMGKIMNETSPATGSETYPMIPTFFFTHKDFFKHFMLSSQHIRNGEEMHTQMILTLQH